jgi:mRNA-degrading endonuclease toxin of MazEF toxin-antitoxin module
MSVVCKYGDIIAVNLSGGLFADHSRFVRYAVVVSADIINENLPTVIVCPLVEADEVRESRIGATYIPKQDTGLELDCLVLSLQVKTVSREHIVKRIGTLPANYQAQLKESLQAVLELED